MKTKTVARVVTAPHTWYCDKCGGRIEAGEQCVKRGNNKFCAKCIKQGGER